LKLHEFSPKRITIIAAEDVDEIRDLVCLFLATPGYLVLPAANGQAAPQVAAALGGPIDLLLTDLDMPGCGGLDLTKALLKVYPRIRALLMSHLMSHPRLRFLGKRQIAFFSQSLSRANSCSKP